MSEENGKAVEEEAKKETAPEAAASEEKTEAPTEEAQADEEAASGGKSKLMIIIIAAVVLVLAAGGGAYFFMGSSEAPKEEAKPAAEQQVEAKEAESVVKKALYFPLAEDFMVNVSSNDGKTHYMRVAITIMTRDAEFLENIKQSEPVIRNELLNMFSLQDFQELLTAQGKRKLRIQALEAVNKALNVEPGKKQVEAVLITNFVME